MTTAPSDYRVQLTAQGPATPEPDLRYWPMLYAIAERLERLVVATERLAHEAQLTRMTNR